MDDSVTNRLMELLVVCSSTNELVAGKIISVMQKTDSTELLESLELAYEAIIQCNYKMESLTAEIVMSGWSK